MKDSLVVEEGILVKFPSVHIVEIHKPPNIRNYLGPPEAPDHLPLATLPCLPEQCNHCGKNLKKNSLSKHMLVVHGASRF